MEGRATTHSLRSAENLSLPQVQVIVMSANMGCSHCRQRVSKVVSNINTGLLDYMVDLRKKEVTVRGTLEKKKRKAHQGRSTKSTRKNKSSSCSLGFFSLNCFGAIAKSFGLN
ncbi:hypothetical protein Cni_G26765 [Canna indica]|uniref:HMA domain-containing protein n=1 Tax=Canna indica TaxID=4628 RepID=A0AAQ3L6S3_9LILI|nr:hypothetical protein Cni_G26765 [Canna indica]